MQVSGVIFHGGICRASYGPLTTCTGRAADLSIDHLVLHSVELREPGASFRGLLAALLPPGAALKKLVLSHRVFSPVPEDPNALDSCPALAELEALGLEARPRVLPLLPPLLSQASAITELQLNSPSGPGYMRLNDLPEAIRSLRCLKRLSSDRCAFTNLSPGPFIGALQ